MSRMEATKEATLLLELAIARSRASDLADEQTKARIRRASARLWRKPSGRSCTSRNVVSTVLVLGSSLGAGVPRTPSGPRVQG